MSSLIYVTLKRIGALARRSLSSGSSSSDVILLTGACGQVGAELAPYLRGIFGAQNVVATDVRPAPPAVAESGPFAHLDVTDALALERLVKEHRVGTIVHLAALLSATGEQNPQLALQVNNQGVTNVLECARVNGLRVFSPSTIAVFGPSTPKHNTPDDTTMRPTTMSMAGAPTWWVGDTACGFLTAYLIFSSVQTHIHRPRCAVRAFLSAVPVATVTPLS